jgi:hypothetical protein
MKELEDMEFAELINLSIEALNSAEAYNLRDEEIYRIRISKEILNKLLEQL